VSAEKAILLLGRRDEPTDGVADYCGKLSEAGPARGLAFEIARVHWAEKGWAAALAELRKAAASWRGLPVFLQFTTLAWSRRGFPLRAPRVLGVLRECGARPGVVFHDFFPLPGKGIVGRAREYSHLRVLRQLYARSEIAVFTVPLNKIAWLPLRREKAIFIPVGSNFPQPEIEITQNERLPATVSVAVFGFTDGVRGVEEVGDIAYTLKFAKSRGVQLRLVALGRGSSKFEEPLRNALNGSGIEVSALGLMPPGDLIRALANSQALLCVRGQVSSRRGNVIAGIACGLPIVGYRGAETGFPITEAGVRLVEAGDREGLAQALASILTDEKLYRELCERSANAARKYFSWDAIATQFANALAPAIPARMND
jgi:glycosyltransferase involved in cell wall biosynthesis